jgi:hypothetical protein
MDLVYSLILYFPLPLYLFLPIILYFLNFLYLVRLAPFFFATKINRNGFIPPEL